MDPFLTVAVVAAVVCVGPLVGYARKSNSTAHTLEPKLTAPESRPAASDPTKLKFTKITFDRKQRALEALSDQVDKISEDFNVADHALIKDWSTTFTKLGRDGYAKAIWSWRDRIQLADGELAAVLDKYQDDDLQKMANWKMPQVYRPFSAWAETIELLPKDVSIGVQITGKAAWGGFQEAMIDLKKWIDQMRSSVVAKRNAYQNAEVVP